MFLSDFSWVYESYEDIDIYNSYWNIGYIPQTKYKKFHFWNEMINP